MSDDQFWIAIWRTVGTVLAVFVMTFGGCTMHSNYMSERVLQNAIAKGANPLDAACAAYGFSERNTVCAIRASSK